MLTGSIIGDIKYQFRHGSVVMKLIFANIAVFAVYGIIAVVGFFAQYHTAEFFLVRNLTASCDWHTMLTKPWTLITYQFYHIEFLHILFNLLWLYWFGQIFILYLGEKKVLPLYITGGIFGWVFFFVALHTIPALKDSAPYAELLGASASIMAIVFASVAINPKHSINLLFFGEVSILAVAMVSFFVDLIDIPKGGAGTFFAHLGGAVWGYSYVKLLQQGYDLFKPFYIVADFFKNLFKPRRNVLVSYKSAHAKPSPGQPRAKGDQEKVDEILDKIARSGYEGLTKEEKDFLFHYSNK